MFEDLQPEQTRAHFVEKPQPAYLTPQPECAPLADAIADGSQAAPSSHADLLDMDHNFTVDHHRPRGGIVGAADLVLGVVAPDLSATAPARRAVFKSLRRGRALKVWTEEDGIQLRDDLLKQISETKLGAKMDLAGKLEEIHSSVAQLRADVEKSLKDARGAVEQYKIELLAFTDGSMARLQREANLQSKDLEKRVTDSMKAIEIAMQASRVREVMRDGQVEGALRKFEAEIVARTAVRSIGLNYELRHQKNEAKQELATTKNHMQAMYHELKKTTEQQWNTLQNDFKVLSQDNFEKMSSRQGQLQDSISGLEESLRSYREQSEEKVTRSIKWSEDKLESIKEYANKHMTWMAKQTENLRTMVSVVENLPTRRIEWVIADAVKTLGQLEGGSLKSPLFNAAGSDGLQLEVSLSDVPSDDEPGKFDKACDVALRARAGLYLVFQVFAGCNSVRFEHCFSGSSVPCVARNLCLVNEQANVSDGTLVIGIEVLESVCESVTLPNSTQFPDQLSTNDAVDESVKGTLVSHRHINHRILDSVQNQVELMRSRMVRKIEWRVEQASVLRRYFPEGECLCSTVFEAAGLHGLQLVFYPSGCAGVRDGYCSFFLYVPAGAALRCWLSIGKQRREGKLSFEKPGCFGRTNFCRYEFCADRLDDSIMLALEIDEAKQDVTESMSHPSAATAANGAATAIPVAMRSIQTLPSSSPLLANQNHFQPLASPSAPSPVSPRPTPANGMAQDKIDSSMTFVRNTGHNTLTDVRQLPSIWTATPQTGVLEVVEGFHGFGDLKTKKTPPGGKRAVSSHDCRRQAAVPAQPPERYLMYT